MRLRQIVLGVVTARAFEGELGRRELQDVAGVGRHYLFVARVVDDKFTRADTVIELFENKIIRVAMRLVVILADADDARQIVRPLGEQ